MTSLKAFARESLPKSLQVPAKYWFGYVRGELEPEMALLSRLVTPGDHVVDVGGNRGIYAYRLARLGARVSVFEPNPICLAALTPWAATRADVTVHAVALSSQAGEAELAIPIDAHGVEHDASASIEHLPAANVRRQTVEMRTLDSFGIRDASLIKIDVEGHEASVLKGAQETVCTSAPAMIVEIEQRHIGQPITAIFDMILSWDYLGYFLDGGRMVPIDRFRLDKDQPVAQLGRKGMRYINNFLFLSRAGVEGGRYSAVLR